MDMRERRFARVNRIRIADAKVMGMETATMKSHVRPPTQKQITGNQWEWGRPAAQAQQPPPPRGAIPHAGAAPPASPMLDANTENFLLNRLDPQWGQGVPSQSEDRTSTSLSFPQLPQ